MVAICSYHQYKTQKQIKEKKFIIYLFFIFPVQLIATIA